MNLEQILEKVIAAGWEQAHIYDSGVCDRSTGKPVRWVWACKGNVTVIANEGVKAPQYNPPIIDEGMRFRAHRPTMYGDDVEFTNVLKAPTPAQVAQIFAMVEVPINDPADEAEAAHDRWVADGEIAAAEAAALAEEYGPVY